MLILKWVKLWEIRLELVRIREVSNSFFAHIDKCNANNYFWRVSKDGKDIWSTVDDNHMIIGFSPTIKTAKFEVEKVALNYSKIINKEQLNLL